MYSKSVMSQVTKAFNTLNGTQDSRRKDSMLSHFLGGRFYEGKYTIAEKRCFVLRSYVRAYDRQRGGQDVNLYATSPLHVILASLLGKEDATRPETMEVNEAMSVARLAIMAMDAEDEQL